MTASDNTDIAIVAVSQTPSYRRYNDSEPRMIMDCVNDLLGQTGLDRHDIGHAGARDERLRDRGIAGGAARR